MKASFWVLACLLSLLASGTQAGITGAILRHPDYPGKCYVNEKTILNEGQTIDTENCRQITCFANGMGGFITCGSTAVSPPCRLGAFKYPKAEYPKCCIKIKHCPEGDAEF